MSPNPELPKIIWGTVRIAQLEDKEKFLEILEKYGVKDLDTAHVYVCLLHRVFSLHYLLLKYPRAVIFKSRSM